MNTENTETERGINSGNDNTPITQTTRDGNGPPEETSTTNSRDDINSFITVFGKIRKTVRGLSFDPLFAVRLFEKFLARSRSILTPALFESISDWFIIMGHATLVTMSGLSLLFWVMAAIKQSRGVYILYGAGYAILFLVLQFSAWKFMKAGKTLVQNSPSRLASDAFLDCLALLSGIAGILLFVNFLTYSEWSYFWTGIAAWVICDLIAYIALNPSLANISLAKEAGAGEEAIGIISFFVKAFMRIVPIAFGTGVSLFMVALLMGIFTLFGRAGNEFDGKSAIDRAALYACLPFASYIIFALYHLIIDILRAILIIPVKLDQLNDRKG
ncbi:MAG: hypothetical protein A2283_10370 [Lentisphaerae bacterium RIFOXYA12_FULL_48_11]|nr:MAG: hypothetical protein A2283_10370 [Lentisphaerae bacterium RIFOXYA12_FULL_48_11]